MRTITLDVMWQIDPFTQEPTGPTDEYQFGSQNCFQGNGTTCLVEVKPGVYAGHVDFDRSSGDGQHLGVYEGAPTEIAQQLQIDFGFLNSARRDGNTYEFPPAELVVWLREFPDKGGVETGARRLLWWRHPATR